MQIPGKNGYLGILSGHAPLIAELWVSPKGCPQPDGIILVEKAERTEEINVKRAEEAKKRAEQRLNNDAKVDCATAQRARAATRLEVVGGNRCNSGAQHRLGLNSELRIAL